MYAPLLGLDRKPNVVENLLDRALDGSCRAITEGYNKVTSSFFGAFAAALIWGAVIDQAVVQKVQPGFGPAPTSKAYPAYCLSLAALFSGALLGARAVTQGLTNRGTGREETM